jgi:hypothetical protein
VQDQCADGMKFTWLFDIREPTNPISIATMPTPSEIDYVAKGAHFGPHNVHENRPGSFVSSERIFTTYQNAGVRVFDIRNPYQPAGIGALVPLPPTQMMDIRPGARASSISRISSSIAISPSIARIRTPARTSWK